MPDIKTTFRVEKISRTKSRVADANGDYPDQWEVEGKYPWDNRFPSKFWLPGHNEAPEIGPLKVVVFKSDRPKKEEYDGNQPWMFSYKFQRILNADDVSTEGEKDDTDPGGYSPPATHGGRDMWPDNRYEWQGARGIRHGMLFNQACEMARIDATNEGGRQPELTDITEWYRSLVVIDNELWQEIGQRPEQTSHQLDKGNLNAEHYANASAEAHNLPPDARYDPVEQSSVPHGTDPQFAEGRVFKNLGDLLNAAYEEFNLYSKDVFRLLDLSSDDIKYDDPQTWSTLDYKSKNPSRD